MIKPKDAPTGNWVCVATFSDVPTASIAAGMLQSNGIPVHITNTTISSIYPMTDSWTPVELMVPPSMAQLADKLLRLDGDK